MNATSADTVVILAFETSGLTPEQGDRVIEVGAILLEQGIITGRYQSLINPGFRVSSFIERLTGITNAMLSKAPSSTTVFSQLKSFIGDHNLVAHNAAFDQMFFDYEMQSAGFPSKKTMACSLLIARRLFQNIPDHKLTTLAKYLGLPEQQHYHRTLADAEMTAWLWLKIIHELRHQHHLEQTTFPFMKKLSRMPRPAIADFLHKQTKVAMPLDTP